LIAARPGAAAVIGVVFRGWRCRCKGLPLPQASAMSLPEIETRPNVISWFDIEDPD